MLFSSQQRQGCPGNTRVANTGRKILGNTDREMRDCPVNTGKLEKKMFKSYIISIERVYVNKQTNKVKHITNIKQPYIIGPRELNMTSILEIQKSTNQTCW